jgi:pyrroline-5-carboxylate reductase
MLCIVGAGNMGKAILGGVLASGRFEVAVVERNEQRRGQLQSEFPAATVVEAPVASDVAVLAVKPKDLEVAARQVVQAGTSKVISVATGYSLASLQTICGDGISVARAMPNVGALVGKSATAVCARDEQDIEWTSEVMSSIGTVVAVDEQQFHAVTATSGSGPAYLFLVAEALVDAAVESGLKRPAAQQLVSATFESASSLLVDSGVSPGELRNRVTTPAGTTVAGLHELESHAVRAAFLEAVGAAASRSRELSAEFGS